MVSSVVHFLAISVFVGCVFGQSKVVQSEDGTAGSIKFSTPNMDDDDAHSPWMPDVLKCDACRAVSFCIWRTFTEYNMKRKSLNYDLPESEILDLTEEVCESDKTWASYGMKEVNKQKRLSGPGMETADTPGVLAGGGKWPSRLRDMCNGYMGELGEMSIYKVFRKNPKSRKRFEDFLCRGPGMRSECTDETIEKRKPPKHVREAELRQLEKEKREFEKERKEEKKKEAMEKKRKDKLRKEKRDAKLKEKEEKERLRKELGEEQPIEEAKRMEEERKKREAEKLKKEEGKTKEAEMGGPKKEEKLKKETKDNLKEESKKVEEEKQKNVEDTKEGKEQKKDQKKVEKEKKKDAKKKEKGEEKEYSEKGKDGKKNANKKSKHKKEKDGKKTDDAKKDTEKEQKKDEL